MQEFDTRHLTAALWRLDAVADHDIPAVALLDKMLALLGIVAIAEPCYFVADAYYAARKIVTGLLKQNNHLLTRVKSNAVAYTAHQQRGPRKAWPAQDLWPQGQAEIPAG